MGYTVREVQFYYTKGWYSIGIVTFCKSNVDTINAAGGSCLSLKESTPSVFAVLFHSNKCVMLVNPSNGLFLSGIALV